MVGGIIIVVVLLVIFPVAIIMSGGVMAAGLGSFMKQSVDSDHKGTEALELSESNPYA